MATIKEKIKQLQNEVNKKDFLLDVMRFSYKNIQAGKRVRKQLQVIRFLCFEIRKDIQKSRRKIEKERKLQLAVWKKDKKRRYFHINNIDKEE